MNSKSTDFNDHNGDSVQNLSEGPGAEAYTELLQKSMTPYITTQVENSVFNAAGLTVTTSDIFNILTTG